MDHVPVKYENNDGMKSKLAIIKGMMEVVLILATIFGV